MNKSTVSCGLNKKYEQEEEVVVSWDEQQQFRGFQDGF